MLASDKLIIRPIEEADLKKIKLWKNDPEIKESLGGFSFGFSDKDILKWYKNAKKEGYRWALVVKSNNKLIGFVGIYNVNYVNRNAEFGILIGDKTAHGKGYATEAMRIIVDYCFNELNLNRIYLYVLANNVPAIKAYEKNGFCLEGKLRQHIYRAGKYIDNYVMGIIKDEQTETNR
jgi:RimJ/RimL family protein N-acetyltransferase